MKNLILVGQANVGKSVLFHRLTGKYAIVSNFPGTTVEATHGPATLGGESYHVYDTPGVASLPPRTDDERVTHDALMKLTPAVVLQVADAKDFERALHLTLEISEYGLPMVLALNLADEMRDRGLSIDTQKLSGLLGIPVILTVATSGEGMKELEKAIARASRLTLKPRFDSAVEKELRSLEADRPNRALATAAFLSNPKIREKFARAPELLRYEGKQLAVREASMQVLTRRGASKDSWLGRLGVWAVRPFPGYLMSLGVLWLLYEFVGVFGAQTLVGFLEETVFGQWINPSVTALVRMILPWEIARSFLVGEYGLITMACTYALALILPIVTTFFIFFGILEDSGYLPRLAAMLDRMMRLIGLNGKAVLPMVLGLGCGTMATVTTRILSTKKEKFLVSLLLTLAVPCSAQLAVVLGMTAAVSWKVFAGWLSAVTLSLVFVGWSASKLLPGIQPPFIMELPPLRLPQASNVFKKVTMRLKWYSMEVIPLFALATGLLFTLDQLHWLGQIEKWMAPVVVGGLGLPAKAAQAFLIGFLRRDYGAAGLFDMARQGQLDAAQVLVSIVLVTLFMPCVAHLLVTVKERGTAATAGIFAFVLSYALIIGIGLHFLLMRFPSLV